MHDRLEHWCAEESTPAQGPVMNQSQVQWFIYLISSLQGHAPKPVPLSQLAPALGSKRARVAMAGRLER